ncbi:hypothetical protein Bbelb_243290 [Branchiostoma belcheri]|nr:hypothetical protein Bbelb_243290 [Branchiostoma belcheri]
MDWTELFVEWLRRLDRKMGRQKWKILLFADNAPSHPDIRLKNVELKFFPTNTTSKLQPMDQGIIQIVSTCSTANASFDASCRSWNTTRKQGPEIAKRVTVLDAI